MIENKHGGQWAAAARLMVLCAAHPARNCALNACSKAEFVHVALRMQRQLFVDGWQVRYEECEMHDGAPRK